MHIGTVINVSMQEVSYDYYSCKFVVPCLYMLIMNVHETALHSTCIALDIRHLL